MLLLFHVLNRYRVEEIEKNENIFWQLFDVLKRKNGEIPNNVPDPTALKLVD